MATSYLYIEEHGIQARKRLAQLIEEVKGEDLLAPVTLVVPTQYAGISLRRSLSAENGLVNVRFMVMPRLAEYVGSPELADKGKAPLSRIIKLAAIRHVAQKMYGQGPLSDLAGHPKLHSSLINTFQDLARLSEAGLAKVESMDALRAQIVVWYRLYSNTLHNYYDREELCWAAAKAVKEGKATSVLNDIGFIVFHLINSFTLGELALIDALSKVRQCAVVLGLTGEPETDVLTTLVADQLKPMIEEYKSTPKIPEQSNCVHHMLIAPDAQEEIRWIVRHIVRQAENGLPFHKMAVLYRQPDPYALLIQSQLRFANIPFAGTDTIPLTDTPAAKLLIYFLEVMTNDFSRDDVMRWIAESPVKSCIDNKLASRELSRWEIISREAGVINGAAQWQERLARYRDGLDHRIDRVETLEEASPAQLRGLHEQRESIQHLRLFMDRLASSLPPPDGSQWDDYVRWAKDILNTYTYNTAEWPPEHQDSYERVITLIGELQALDDFLPGGTDLADFCLMLHNILEAPSGRTGMTGTGVFVAPIAAVQAMDFDVIYIVGMAEGAFPPAIRDDAVLPDRMRMMLPDTDRLPLRQARRTEERRLFLAALAAGKKRIISYPRTDALAQRGQHPSPWFVSQVGNLHGSPVSSVDLETLETKPWLSLIYSSQHGLEYAHTLAPADIHDYDMSSIAKWQESNFLLEDHFLMNEGSPGHRALQMERGRQGNNFTVWDGQLFELTGKSHRLRLPQNSRFSPTRLERWAVCPFRYFVRDILGISVSERPEEVMTISPQDRGALLHRVMERFIKTTQEEGVLPEFGESWKQPHLELIKNIAENEFQEAEASGITGRRLLWDIAKEEMRQDLMAFLEIDSRWRIQEKSRPLWVERRFGFDEDDSLPPVVLILKNGIEVRLRGLIDRVDGNTFGSKILIVDYKFGSSSQYKDMDRDPLGKGKHLQLPVYALAASNIVGESVEVVALYWFATARGNFEMKAVPLSIVEDRFRDMIEIIASGIEHGLFPANPGSTDNQTENCRYCDFDRICPANRDMLWERKSQNPELAAYLSLRDLNSPKE